MSLPRAAGEYLLEKVPHQVVLLTGLGKDEGRFLRHCADASVAPGREDFPFFTSGDQRHRPGTALLSGRREQFDRLVGAARVEPALQGLVEALVRSVEATEVAP